MGIFGYYCELSDTFVLFLCLLLGTFGNIFVLQGLSERMLIMNILEYIFFLVNNSYKYDFRTTIDVVFYDYSLFAFSSLRITHSLL